MENPGVLASGGSLETGNLTPSAWIWSPTILTSGDFLPMSFLKHPKRPRDVFGKERLSRNIPPKLIFRNAETLGESFFGAVAEG